MKVLTITLVLLLVVSPSWAASTGDPIDGNERTMGSVEVDCARAILYPQCNWCWTTCLYAIMVDAWFGGGGWDDLNWGR